MVLERILLQTIKFDLQVEHPYQFLLKYAKQLKDICHQILDLYSQGKQQMPHHATQQNSPQVQAQIASVQAQLQQQSQNAESPASQQKDPQQSKKPSPQSSPPKPVKRPVPASPKEEAKALEPPAKLSKIETLQPPLPPVLPPPERKPLVTTIAVSEGDPVCVAEAAELTKIQIPPPAHPAPVHQPPPLPLRPPPPPPSSYITGMSTTNSYMSGEGYQNLQSMMKTDGPSYGALPPAYGPPSHMPYHPHVYPPNPPPSVPPPPPTTFPPPNIPPPAPVYPPPTYNPNFPPPRLPPSHAVPNHPPPGIGMPPTSYPPPSVPPGGQPPVPPQLPPPGMPSVAGLGRTAWMR
ncbi:hypothetical protein FKM82_017154 [Ascaphus truei]